MTFFAMATTNAEPTPNPNSLKFTAKEGSFTQKRMETYASVEEAREHPLAERLFSVSGVEDVLITPEFVTVSKRATVDWEQIKPELETILQEHLES